MEPSKVVFAVRTLGDDVVKIAPPAQFTARLSDVPARTPGRGVTEGVSVRIQRYPTRVYTHLLDPCNGDGRKAHGAIALGIDALEPIFLTTSSPLTGVNPEIVSPSKK